MELKDRINGVEGQNPSGVKVRIFVDVLGFVGDYPASASVIDVVGHVGRSCCTVCSFRRLQDSSTEGSKFGYTTALHSNHSIFLRTGERHTALRKSDIPEDDAKKLGMVQSHRYSDRECPLLYFQREIGSKKGNVMLRDDGTPVISGTFDAFRNNIIAPDHLLTGLAKDILNATFQTMPTEALRIEIDLRMCAALRTNGLLPQKEIFNKTSNKMHSMTLSEVFCVLAVSIPVINNVISRCSAGHDIHDYVNLLQQLQRIITYSYWWPEELLDGPLSMIAVRKHKEKYFSDLRKMSKTYVKSVDRICRKSPEVRKQTDKPNLHRLIELYELSIPMFGHIREIMELVFESAHQPLKRSINRKKSSRSHIFAVEQCVEHDWQGRSAALSRAELHSNIETKRGLRRLLLGQEADLLHEERHEGFIKNCDRTLERLFTPSLRKQFSRSGMVANFGASKYPQWKARTMIEVDLLASTTKFEKTFLKNIIKLSKRWVQALNPFTARETDERDLAVHIFKSARRLKMTTFGTQIGHPYGHDMIYANCAVVVHIDERKGKRRVVVPSTRDSNTRPVFFAILGILEQEGELPWALCLKCTKRGKLLQRSPPLNEDSFQLLQLSPTVRRVGLYHACCVDSEETNTCNVNIEKKLVTHSKSLLNGGSFLFQCRVQGYPPRMA